MENEISFTPHLTHGISIDCSETNLISCIFLVLEFNQKGELSNAELRILTEELSRIRYGDNDARIKHISIRGLLPDTEHYMTYEGSTTAPGCHETVTWIVLNKPIYITLQQVSRLNLLCYLAASEHFMPFAIWTKAARHVHMNSCIS